MLSSKDTPLFTGRVLDSARVPNWESARRLQTQYQRFYVLRHRPRHWTSRRYSTNAWGDGSVNSREVMSVNRMVDPVSALLADLPPPGSQHTCELPIP